MSKLVALMNTTLDGFVARTNGSLDWHFDYWDEQLYNEFCKQLYQTDLILLGANTYDAFYKYWGQNSSISLARQDILLAELMNNSRKVVVTKTPANILWNNTSVLKGDLSRAIRHLKKSSLNQIVVLGSSQLVSSLMHHDLIDRYELFMHPIVIGKGKTLFSKLTGQQKLQLQNAKKLSSGVVHFSYVVARFQGSC